MCPTVPLLRDAAAASITKMHFKTLHEKQTSQKGERRLATGETWLGLAVHWTLDQASCPPSFSFSLLLLHFPPSLLCVYLSNDFAKYAQKWQQQRRNMLPLNGL